MIRLLLAEDQHMVRGALKALLELERDIRVVAEAADGAEAVRLALETKPDVALFDIEMPALSGLDAAAALRDQLPGCRVAIVTTFARAGYLRRALELNVQGYLLKDQPAEQLAGAVRQIASGRRVIDPELALAAWDEPNPLSERERDVLKLVGAGLGNTQIAQRLRLAEGTVKNYLSEAMAKLSAQNRTQAARIAEEKGWLY
ncbi:MAG TPA: response regulator transcription factor [Limnochordia bacterium]|nr:response regulator transcription factor [Limnochordia bacterium]